jgi:hypothetical protein
MLNLPPNSKPGRKNIQSAREYIFNALTSAPSSEALPELAEEGPNSQEHNVFTSTRTAGSLIEI